MMEDQWDDLPPRKKVTYKDRFTIEGTLGDNYVCVSENEFGNENQTLVNIDFLKAHDLEMGDTFTAKIDYGNCIVLESIEKMEDY